MMNRQWILPRIAKRVAVLLTAVLLLTLTNGFNWNASTAEAAGTTPVERYGQLSVKSGKLVDKNGQPVQLKGISSHGVQWFGDLVNQDTMKWLRDDWGISVFRVALYTEENGYIANPSLKNKVKEAIEAAQKLGLYVIIDWHILSDGDPNIHKNEAKAFFNEFSTKYGHLPNVIYELANEPNGNVNWNNQIRPYASEVSQVIRARDPDNIIIVGTGTWSQDVHDAADHPLPDKNTMYTVHFYAGTHGQYLRDRVDYALNKGVGIFATEWGTSDASGNGGPFLNESKVWTDFLASRKISWANWSLADKNETSAALLPGADRKGGWPDSQLTASGKFVKQAILEGSSSHGGGSNGGNNGGDGNNGGSNDGGNSGGNNGNDHSGSTPGGNNEGIVLQYRTDDTNAKDNAIRPQFNIKNTGKTAVKLSDLKIRYYYTDESKQAQQFFVDWAKIGNEKVKATFVTLPNPKVKADKYVEISFTDGAGTIQPGGETGEIQSRIHAANWSNFDETNDYSYGATQTAFADWDHGTVYQQGKLVWGIEP
ncbi:cellulase family glycosylhydrolase [Paenibacillus polymyxa]|uniref:cellulase family glycosylhydrolase n=1 Tax=Paenibacillus polymyxa TaxID=1406 RepID=UPI0025B71651|nr:cellulase family glycosylhydrolase [Paenibacillus polymyxa]MDN4077735.1 cellulase family glycosylhydrolase [Paenibacillus polymyxa]MDN4103159.1 cellulase family glycosylhydrolase [Paenibacillus polymyxa]MDN4114208.1 cellulase family glycosylhydrolase [Paenibacillus polymyxa]